MLVPGEFLTCPVPAEQSRVPVARRVDAERLHEPMLTVPSTVSEKAEPQSFLMTLLNALGAVHT
jgi:hypothetical protein